MFKLIDSNFISYIVKLETYRFFYTCFWKLKLQIYIYIYDSRDYQVKMVLTEQKEKLEQGEER